MIIDSLNKIVTAGVDLAKAAKVGRARRVAFLNIVVKWKRGVVKGKKRKRGKKKNQNKKSGAKGESKLRSVCVSGAFSIFRA